MKTAYTVLVGKSQKKRRCDSTTTHTWEDDLIKFLPQYGHVSYRTRHFPSGIQNKTVEIYVIFAQNNYLFLESTCNDVGAL